MGFNNEFLGNQFKIQLPFRSDHDEFNIIEYIHFSTYFFKPRKFALYCACNIPTLDKRIKVDRPNTFKKDIENLEKTSQIGHDFYKSKENDHPTIGNKNLLDRGHVIRREYPQWETEEIAKKASEDTFFFANIAPQHYLLNQGDWKDLESYVVSEVNNKVSVFSGCLFDEADPIAFYNGAETKKKQSFYVPLKFWKIVYYLKDSKLCRIGFVLSQEKILRHLDFIYFPSERVKALSIVKDPFADLDEDLVPYIVDVKSIEFATGLRFTPAIEGVEIIEQPKTYLLNNYNRSISFKFSKEKLTNYI